MRKSTVLYGRVQAGRFYLRRISTICPAPVSIAELRSGTYSYKVRDVRNFERPQILDELEREPRYLELLWLLQWVSNPANYPGGIQKFASDFIAAQEEKVGTPSMIALRESKTYTFEDFSRIYEEVPFACWDAHGWEDASLERSRLDEFKRSAPARLQQAVLETAREQLFQYFRDLCEDPTCRFETAEKYSGKGAPWYWPTVCKDLIVWIEKIEQAALSNIAQTRTA